jgi:hypothetical protein
MRPYIVASAIAVGLILAGVIFVHATSSYVASLGIPPDGGMELPSSTLWRLWLADMLSDFWWALIPLVLIVCLGAAWLMAAGPKPAK